MGNGVLAGVTPVFVATAGAGLGVSVGFGLQNPQDEPYSQLPQSNPHHDSGALVGFGTTGVAPPASGAGVGVVGQSPI